MLGEKKKKETNAKSSHANAQRKISQKRICEPHCTLQLASVLCDTSLQQKKYFRGSDHISSSELRRKYFSLQKIWTLSKFRLWQVWSCFHSICFLHHANQWSMKQNVMFSYITQYNAVSRQNAQNTFSYISQQKIHYLFIQK